MTGSQTLTNKTLTAPQITQAINTQTGTSYTLVIADDTSLVTLANASAIALTIPLNSSVAFPIGACVDIVQFGAGQVTVSGASGVTLVSTGATSATPKTRVQNSAITLRKLELTLGLLLEIAHKMSSSLGIYASQISGHLGTYLLIILVVAGGGLVVENLVTVIEVAVGGAGGLRCTVTATGGGGNLELSNIFCKIH